MLESKFMGVNTNPLSYRWGTLLCMREKSIE